MYLHSKLIAIYAQLLITGVLHANTYYFIRQTIQVTSSYLLGYNNVQIHYAIMLAFEYVASVAEPGNYYYSFFFGGGGGGWGIVQQNHWTSFLFGKLLLQMSCICTIYLQNNLFLSFVQRIIVDSLRNTSYLVEQMEDMAVGKWD